MNHHNLQGDEHAKRFPVANHVDLFLLGKTILSMVNGTLEFGPSAILTAWCQRLAERYAGSGAVTLPIPGKRILLVVDRDYSIHVLMFTWPRSWRVACRPCPMGVPQCTVAFEFSRTSDPVYRVALNPLIPRNKRLDPWS